MWESPLTEKRIALYAEFLSQYFDAESLNRACREATARSDRFPVPATIIRFASEQKQSKIELDAKRAFQGVLDHVREWGSDRIPLFQGGNFYYPPRFDSATAYAVRICGGLRAIEDTPERGDSAHFLMKNFTEAYGYFRRTRALTEISGDDHGFPEIEEALSDIAALKSMPAAKDSER